MGPKFSRGSEIFSRGYFVGQNFFLMIISCAHFFLVVDFVTQRF